MGRMLFRRWLRVVPIMACCGWGCGSGADARRYCEALHVCDAPPQPRQLVDVLCDTSTGSTCSVDHLTATLTGVFHRVAPRPGSRVRLWVLGASVDATDLIAEITSPVNAGKTERARRAEIERWQTHAVDVFLAGAAPILTAKQPKSSPLAEAITAIALADGHGLERQIVAVTDGREMGLADFECGALPSDTNWAARLKQGRVLGAGSLAGIDVALTYLTLPPISRCAVSLKRELRIRDLWKSALAGAGARDVRLFSGPVTWEERGLTRDEEGKR